MLGRLLVNDEDDKASSLDDDFDDSGLSEIVGGKLTFNDGENASSSADKYSKYEFVSLPDDWLINSPFAS